MARLPSAKGGVLTMTPGWEGLLMPQIVEEMDDLGEDAYKMAKDKAPRLKGYTKAGVEYQVDPSDGSMYLNSGGAPGSSVWDAAFSEYGAGHRGRATGGDSTFPSPFRYGDVDGRPAQPFIRPSALAAVKKKFGAA